MSESRCALWLRLSVVAEILNVHKGQISRLVKSGRLLSNGRVGRDCRVRAESVLVFLLERRRRELRKELRATRGGRDQEAQALAREKSAREALKALPPGEARKVELSVRHRDWKATLTPQGQELLEEFKMAFLLGDASVSYREHVRLQRHRLRQRLGRVERARKALLPP
jgi:hypothetical protein